MNAGLATQSLFELSLGLAEGVVLILPVGRPDARSVVHAHSSTAASRGDNQLVATIEWTLGAEVPSRCRIAAGHGIWNLVNNQEYQRNCLRVYVSPTCSYAKFACIR